MNKLSELRKEVTKSYQGYRRAKVQYKEEVKFATFYLALEQS